MQIKRVHIKNFKSIVDLPLDLAPINVFIGENGSGKSNILEALAFVAAAAANKLDNEFLVSRGIRVTNPRFMRSAFSDAVKDAISINVEDEQGVQVAFDLNTSGDISYPRWETKDHFSLPPHMLSEPVASFPLTNSALGIDSDDILARLESITGTLNIVDSDINNIKGQINTVKSGLTAKDSLPVVDIINKIDQIKKILSDNRIELTQLREEYAILDKSITSLNDFIIYSPEVTALRTFEKEGQILPLGVRGEGLLKLLRVLAHEDKAAWSTLQHNLGLLDWLQGVEIDHDTTLPEQSIQLRDRFVAETQPAFDQRSANEGFLYLLFFFALILSKATPRFFAIENVDTSLNPKACSELMRRITSLAHERQKQILLTTHNPSLLDGLNLHDDHQRLFVVYRNRDGHTTARRVKPPQPVGNEPPIKLSEAFVRGLLGGIPQNF